MSRGPRPDSRTSSHPAAPSPPQVNAFIVRKGNPGLRTSKLDNKIALRCVQNADMAFSQCFVPDSARLPGVGSFGDTNKVGGGGGGGVVEPGGGTCVADG